MFDHKNQRLFCITGVLALSVSIGSNAKIISNEVNIKKENFNIVEIFDVESEALKYINSVTAKVKSSTSEDREKKLVELALLLDYYQQRYSKGPVTQEKILNQILDLYLEAVELSVKEQRIRYTRPISELAVKLQKKAVLTETFNRFMELTADKKGVYLAKIDYADGLANFKDSLAIQHFESAIAMRNPVDGVEAYYRYARYLLDIDQPKQALEILDQFTLEQRGIYGHVALLRQHIMHQLKMDTSQVDNEIDRLRKKLSKAAFVGNLPKVVAISSKPPKNLLGLRPAYAFSHTAVADDSRGPLANTFIVAPLSNVSITPMLVNATEVVYNEARGEPQNARIAVAWAIRNRANINMNGCDFYPGAEGQGNVGACRTATPGGPQPQFVSDHKRYSCVIHGGTTTVGASHEQMNDGHVDFASLDASGFIWELIFVFNGWFPDITSSDTPSGIFTTGAVYPVSVNTSAGNPAGAQEWRSINYCAQRSDCKVRLGNIGGDLTDPGDPCPGSGGPSTDNFFWGRKP
ncbi:hypothetical protein FKG94_22120 [Exilibacterium tricleocarpae]|uniref:Uncharacterized protein n=1 Tax=Exilibacterium tricleocarpae TaxID=2591008 RepID=A0A545SZ11_9GAMM|nr:hypothetical protein [Exilibacterium tricleocarpae]TQV70212.1 hypothetical protein FKG94_22120 [Exilibacterium tricleocarpae]